MENREIIQTTDDPTTKKIAYIIYILYLLVFIMPNLPLIAVILAYIFENDEKNILKSHYQYLIRTFWIGLLYFIIALSTIFLVIGIILVPLWAIWWIIRLARGIKSLSRNEPIANPKTWIF